MAVTRLSDIIEPAGWTAYMLQKTMALSALYQSGIIVADEEIMRRAKAGGSIINIPFWNDLGNQDSNIGSDDPAVLATAQKINAGQDKAHMHYRNQSWSSMDLAAAIAGDDPAKRIAERVAEYWNRDMQRVLIASLTGVFGDNAANAAGDMILDIAKKLAAEGAVGTTNMISANSVIDAIQTMGDAGKDISAIAMHSAVYSRLVKAELIQTVRPSTDVWFQTFQNLRVIVDDGCPAVRASGADPIVFTSYLFGKGAVANGEGTPKVPTETIRVPSAGNGEGQETLHSRRHFLLHPRGIKFTGASVAGASPTGTELAAAANWSRVYERKAIRLVALKTNG